MREPVGSSPASGIPPLIKRNTALFALSQSFTGAGMQFAFGLGPLMVIAGAVSVLMALVTGPLIQYHGLSAAGLTAILVSLAPLPMLLAIRLRHRSAHRRSATPVPETRTVR